MRCLPGSSKQLRACGTHLQVPIRVVYLDRTAMPGEGGSSAVATYDFTPEGCAGAPPRVHLLYRPGHYDVLYPAPPAPAPSA